MDSFCAQEMYSYYFFFLVFEVRGDLGSGYSVFVEELFSQGVRLTILDMDPSYQGIYTCGFGGIFNQVNITLNITNGG